MMNQSNVPIEDPSYIVLKNAMIRGLGYAMSDCETVLKITTAVRMLCDSKAEIKLSTKFCMICKEDLESQDTSVYSTTKCCQKAFYHTFCVFKVTEDNLVIPNCIRCESPMDKAISECKSIFARPCWICKTDLKHADPTRQQKLVTLQCCCLENQVHERCAEDYYLKGIAKQEFVCQQCNCQVTPESLEVALSQLSIDCLQCQHSFGLSQLIMLKCEDTYCRGCLQRKNFLSTLQVNRKKLCDVKCLNCAQHIEFQDMIKLINLLESEKNRPGLINEAEMAFGVPQCPGKILVAKESDETLQTPDGVKTEIIPQQEQMYILKSQSYAEQFAEEAKERNMELQFCGYSFQEKNQDSTDVKKMDKYGQCPRCTFHFCLNCSDPHFGLTCDIFYQLSKKKKQKNEVMRGFGVSYLPVLKSKLSMQDSMFINYDTINVMSIFQVAGVEEMHIANGEINKDIDFDSIKFGYYYFPIESLLQLNLVLLNGLQVNFNRNYKDVQLNDEKKYSHRNNRQSVVLYQNPELLFDELQDHCDLNDSKVKIVVAFLIKSASVFHMSTNQNICFLYNVKDAYPVGVGLKPVD